MHLLFSQHYYYYCPCHEKNRGVARILNGRSFSPKSPPDFHGPQKEEFVLVA
jgi:hypothetical protein